MISRHFWLIELDQCLYLLLIENFGYLFMKGGRIICSLNQIIHREWFNLFFILIIVIGVPWLLNLIISVTKVLGKIIVVLSIRIDIIILFFVYQSIKVFFFFLLLFLITSSIISTFLGTKIIIEI